MIEERQNGMANSNVSFQYVWGCEVCLRDRPLIPQTKPLFSPVELQVPTHQNGHIFYRNGPLRKHGLMVGGQVKPIAQLTLNGLTQTIKRHAAHEIG